MDEGPGVGLQEERSPADHRKFGSGVTCYPRVRHPPVTLPHHRDHIRVDIQSQQDYFSQASLRLAFGVSC